MKDFSTIGFFIMNIGTIILIIASDYLGDVSVVNYKQDTYLMYKIGFSCWCLGTMLCFMDPTTYTLNTIREMIM